MFTPSAEKNGVVATGHVHPLPVHPVSTGTRVPPSSPSNTGVAIAISDLPWIESDWVTFVLPTTSRVYCGVAVLIPTFVVDHFALKTKFVG
ncbi:hypothetical protein [Chryseobacterium limigenitum]|uniref:hypothetical protein n=1 Tax=Chryseobacterium limigenitum TaxID=1612149 RepID=UPI000930CC4B